MSDDRVQKIRGIAQTQITDLVIMGMGAIPFAPDPTKSDEEEAVRLIRMLLAKLDDLKPMLGV